MRYHFSFYPSRQIMLCIILGHLLAMTALAQLSLPEPALVLLLFVLTLSAIYYVLRDAQLKLPGSWVALRLEEDRVILLNRKGDELAGKLLRSSVVMPHMAILNIAVEHHYLRQNVLLMSDSMDAESFRRLRVALKWGVTLAV